MKPLQPTTNYFVGTSAKHTSCLFSKNSGYNKNFNNKSVYGKVLNVKIQTVS